MFLEICQTTNHGIRAFAKQTIVIKACWRVFHFKYRLHFILSGLSKHQVKVLSLSRLRKAKIVFDDEIPKSIKTLSAF